MSSPRGTVSILLPVHLIQRYPYSIAIRVVGHSMEPTLMDRDAVLLDVAVPGSSKPQRDDVVCAYVRGRGHICGRFRRTRSGFWLYKDNRNDSSWPRVFLGRTSDDFVITGTVRCIVERPGRVNGDLDTIMIRDVTPAVGNLQPRTPAQLSYQQDSAGMYFQLMIMHLRPRAKNENKEVCSLLTDDRRGLAVVATEPPKESL